MPSKKRHRFDELKDAKNPNSMSVSEMKRGDKPFARPKGSKKQQGRLIIQESLEEHSDA